MSAPTFERDFIRHVHRNHGGFFPTWPLGRPVALGDLVRTRRGGRMHWDGSVASYDIRVQERPIEGGAAAVDTEWASESSVEFESWAAGSAPPEDEEEGNDEETNVPTGKAGIRIRFTREGGFIFIPRGMRYSRIENLIEVRQQLLAAAKSGHFGGRRRSYLVTEIAEVESFALVISKSSSALVELALSLNEAPTRNELSRLDVGLRMVTNKKTSYAVVGESPGAATFFKAEKFRVAPGLRTALLAANPLLFGRSEEDLLDLVPFGENAAEILELTPATWDDFEDLFVE